MPFQSEKQRKYLWANEPAIAREWTDKYGSRVKKANGGSFWDPRNSYTAAFVNNKLTPFINNLMNRSEIDALEESYGWGSGGLPSIARHASAGSNVSDKIADFIGGRFTGGAGQPPPDAVSQFIGDVGSWGLGARNEIPGIIGGITGRDLMFGKVNPAKYRAETLEDFKANTLGTFRTPYGRTSKDIYTDVHGGKYAHLFDKQKGTIIPDKGIMQTNVLSNIWDAIKSEFGGSAEAAYLSDMIPKNLEKTIEEKMQSYNKSNEISPALRKAIEEGTSYNEWDRIPNEKYFGLDIQRNYIPTGSINDLYKTASLNQEEETFIDPNRIPGRIQKSVPRKMGMLERFRNRFYKPAAGAVNYGGRTYSPAQLNSMNALGGYYSEPAREKRRLDARRTNILNRAAKGKPVGNVSKLLGPNYRGTPGGGIQFTGRHEGSSTAGAGYSRSDSGWSSSPFRRGGLASLWQR